MQLFAAPRLVFALSKHIMDAQRELEIAFLLLCLKRVTLVWSVRGAVEWAKSVCSRKEYINMHWRWKRNAKNANTFLSILWSWRECNVMELGHCELAKVEFFCKKTTPSAPRSVKKIHIHRRRFFVFFLLNNTNSPETMQRFQKKNLDFCLENTTSSLSSAPTTPFAVVFWRSTVSPAPSPLFPVLSFPFKFNNLPAVCFSRDSPSSPGPQTDCGVCGEPDTT